MPTGRCFLSCRAQEKEAAAPCVLCECRKHLIATRALTHGFRPAASRSSPALAIGYTNAHTHKHTHTRHKLGLAVRCGSIPHQCAVRTMRCRPYLRTDLKALPSRADWSIANCGANYKRFGLGTLAILSLVPLPLKEHGLQDRFRARLHCSTPSPIPHVRRPLFVDNIPPQMIQPATTSPQHGRGGGGE